MDSSHCVKNMWHWQGMMVIHSCKPAQNMWRNGQQVILRSKNTSNVGAHSSISWHNSFISDNLKVEMIYAHNRCKMRVYGN